MEHVACVRNCAIDTTMSGNKNQEGKGGKKKKIQPGWAWKGRIIEARI